MKNRLLSTLFWVVLITGCATYSKLTQMNQFKATAESYGHAIRWSDFETADYFRMDALTGTDPLDFKQLKSVEVTRYEVKQVVPINVEDESRDIEVSQVVEIKYFTTKDMVQKTIKDNQLWEYVAEHKKWLLKSGFPDFK